eukprot:scaffold436_cov267-Pinguiococcus_pyrenoidosus.AAC.22
MTQEKRRIVFNSTWRGYRTFRTGLFAGVVLLRLAAVVDEGGPWDKKGLHVTSTNSPNHRRPLRPHGRCPPQGDDRHGVRSFVDRLLFQRDLDVVEDASTAVEGLFPLRLPAADAQEGDAEEQIEFAKEEPQEPEEVGLHATGNPPEQEILAAQLQPKNHPHDGQEPHDQQQGDADDPPDAETRSSEAGAPVRAPLVDEARAGLEVDQHGRDGHARDRDEEEREEVHGEQRGRLVVLFLLTADPERSNEGVGDSGTQQGDEEDFRLEHDLGQRRQRMVLVAEADAQDRVVIRDVVPQVVEVALGDHARAHQATHVGVVGAGAASPVGERPAPHEGALLEVVAPLVPQKL